MERGFPYVIDRVKLTNNRLRTIFGSISNRWLKSTIQNSATETCQLPTFPGTPETSNRRVRARESVTAVFDLLEDSENEITVELCALGTG